MGIQHGLAPPRSHLQTKKVGQFKYLGQSLVSQQDLKERGYWTPDLKSEIGAHDYERDTKNFTKN